MKFFEKLKSRKLSKILSGVALSGMLFFGSGDALAADSSDAMWAFRESYLSVSTNTRSFNQMITFFGGTVFKADINADSQILRDASMRIKGVANWSYTSPQTNRTTNFNIPFYITQDGNSDVTLYVQRNKNWSKIMLPGFPGALANVLKTNDLNVMQENLKAVKSVEIFKETDVQRIMRIVVDGNYVANLLDKYEDQSSDSAAMNRNLRKAFVENNVLITWTVNKQTNETAATTIELTDLMRSYARGMLADSAAGTLKLTQEEMSLLDAIGYYSEFHYSLSYGGTVDENDESLNPPANVMKAPVNDGVLDDLESDMVAVVK